MPIESDRVNSCAPEERNVYSKSELLQLRPLRGDRCIKTYHTVGRDLARPSKASVALNLDLIGTERQATTCVSLVQVDARQRREVIAVN